MMKQLEILIDRQVMEGQIDRQIDRQIDSGSVEEYTDDGNTGMDQISQQITKGLMD